MSQRVSEFIRANAVFTSAELFAFCGDTQNTRNLLHNAVKAGRVRKVRRGLYASASGRFEGSHPPFQLVASKAASDAVLCYLSAFTLFVGSQDALAEAPFYTALSMSPFEFDGIRFLPYPMSAAPMETRTYRLAGGQEVVGTTREQTVVDSLANVARAGGAEAIMRRLSAVRFLDAEKAVRMAVVRGPSACSRLGWVLERKAGDWDVSGCVLDELASGLGGGPYYLGPAQAREDLDKRWRLYLPEDAQTVEGWLNG